MKPTSLRASRGEATLGFDPASVVGTWLPLLETKVLKSTLLRPRPSFARVYLAHVDETKVLKPNLFKTSCGKADWAVTSFACVYLAHFDETKIFQAFII